MSSSLHTSPWDQPPTHRWWLSLRTAIGDIPSHRREYYPKPVVPRQHLLAPDAAVIAAEISALDPRKYATGTMRGLDARRKEIDRIHERAHVRALQASLTSRSAAPAASLSQPK